MQQNTDISNFELTDEDMATIATLDMGYSLFCDHYDAKTTHMFNSSDRVESTQDDEQTG